MVAPSGHTTPGDTVDVRLPIRQLSVAVGSSHQAVAVQVSVVRVMSGGQLLTTMWMFPAEVGVARVDVMKAYASEPTAFDNPSAADTNAKGKAWLQRWTKTVLK